jgi:hypothetical protein
MKQLQMMGIVFLFLGSTLAPQSFADKGAADDLMAALKACKADAAAMKSAKAMIDKHGGTPTDDQVDNWVDDQDDALFDCLDKKL